MAPRRRRSSEPPPDYGPNDELFSIEMHHRGFFCGQGSHKSYVDGRIDYFDGCDVDSWSPLWIMDFVQQLGYDPGKVDIAWLLPGKKLADGLRIVDCDADTISMTSVVPKLKIFVLYVNQHDIFADIMTDDVSVPIAVSFPSQDAAPSVDDPAQSSQTSMLELLMQTATPTQQSQVVPGPLPESSFIANSRDAMPLPRARTTTAIAARKMKKSMGPKKKK